MCDSVRLLFFFFFLRPELGARGMRGSKPAGFSGVGERAARAHLIGLAAAAVLVAPLVRVLSSSAIS